MTTIDASETHVPAINFNLEVGVPPEKTTEWANKLRDLADKIEEKSVRELTQPEVAAAITAVSIAGVAGIIVQNGPEGARGAVGNLARAQIGVFATLVLGEIDAMMHKTHIDNKKFVNPYTESTIPISSHLGPMAADALRWVAKAVDGSDPRIQIGKR